jgi:hypothetical protein
VIPPPPSALPPNVVAVVVDVARYTLRDVRERIEVQILSTRIQERVAAGLSGRSGQKAFAKFVAEYEQRWQARTVCAPEYVIDRCSNGSGS